MSFNILIVDDSATTRAVIKRTIGLAGVPIDKILEAANGLIGLEHMATNCIDLVLLDLNMPEMGGIEFVRTVRSTPSMRNVPVVVVSSESMDRRIEMLRAEGIRGYIQKPFTPEQIKNLVTKILGVVHAV